MSQRKIMIRAQAPLVDGAQIIRGAGHAIDVMGGTRKMALWAKVTQGAVSQWRQNGIPAAYHRRLGVHLQRLGFVFDMVERVSIYSPVLSKSDAQSVDG